MTIFTTLAMGMKDMAEMIGFIGGASLVVFLLMIIGGEDFDGAIKKKYLRTVRITVTIIVFLLVSYLLGLMERSLILPIHPNV